MKLTRLTSLSSALLFIVILVFGIVLFYEQHALQERQEDYRQISMARQYLSSNVLSPVKSYLYTSDPQFLETSQRNLSIISDRLATQNSLEALSESGSENSQEATSADVSMSFAEAEWKTLRSVLIKLSSTLNNHQHDTGGTNPAEQDSHAEMKSYLDSITELLNLIETKLQAEFSGLLKTQQISIVISFLIVIIIVTASNKLLSMLAQKLSGITPIFKTYAEGDLRPEIEVSAVSEELNMLKSSANRLRLSLSEIIMGIRNKSGIVSATSKHVRESSQSVYASIDMQMVQTNEITEATDKMTEAFKEVAATAADAASKATSVQSRFDEGNKTLQDTLNDISDLNGEVRKTSEKLLTLQGQAQKVESVVGMIEEIAEQTNLLALNAAIEAARAGEHGRGFAVVADEVRALAHKTSQSTLEIGEITGAIQTQASECVSLMEQQVQSVTDSAQKGMKSTDELKQMVSLIQDIVAESNSIAATTQEQSQVAIDIAANIRQINSFSSAIRMQQEVVSNDSVRLESESGALLDSVSQFLVAEELVEKLSETEEPLAEELPDSSKEDDDILF